LPLRIVLAALYCSFSTSHFTARPSRARLPCRMRMAISALARRRCAAAASRRPSFFPRHELYQTRPGHEPCQARLLPCAASMHARQRGLSARSGRAASTSRQPKVQDGAGTHSFRCRETRDRRAPRASACGTRRPGPTHGHAGGDRAGGAAPSGASGGAPRTATARLKATWRICHQEMVALALRGMGSRSSGLPRRSVSCASLRPPARRPPPRPSPSQLSEPNPTCARRARVAARRRRALHHGRRPLRPAPWLPPGRTARTRRIRAQLDSCTPSSSAGRQPSAWPPAGCRPARLHAHHINAQHGRLNHLSKRRTIKLSRQLIKLHTRQAPTPE